MGNRLWAGLAALLVTVCSGCGGSDLPEASDHQTGAANERSRAAATATLDQTFASDLRVEVTISFPFDEIPDTTQVLQRDTGRLLVFLDALPPVGSTDECHDDAGPRVSLVVRSEEGEVITVQAATFGCEEVTGWGPSRGEGRRVYELVTELLERQRIGTLDPDAFPAVCPSPLWPQLTIDREPVPHWDAIATLDPAVIGPPYPAVAARLCRYDATGPGSTPTIDRVVGPEPAEALRQHVVDDLTFGSAYPCPLETARADVLVFADGAGGSFEVRVSRGDCHGIRTGSPIYAHGTAGTSMLRQLDELLG